LKTITRTTLLILVSLALPIAVSDARATDNRAVKGATENESGSVADSEEFRRAFIDANILSVFYHEFGHAVIDLLGVPIYGQEEDAADVVSVLLIDRFFDEEDAQDIAYDSAFGYINDPDGQEEVPYWDLHGPDEQRYYNHVCLFYGANPDERTELADDLGLPEERAESCSEEYAQAEDSWGALFEEMSEDTELKSKLTLKAGSFAGAKYAEDYSYLNHLLSDEINHINSRFSLPEEVTVTIDKCGEANAYYDPEAMSIGFCVEFVDHLASLYNSNLSQ
jgi:hypothetical protein